MFRIGQSTDIHRLVLNRPLVLGGVTIEHTHGLDGHSDADVLIHVVCEALLGALGLGDLGTHYPDTDPAFKGVKSTVLLEDTVAKMFALGYRVENIDTLILAQAPKMSPYKQQMKQNISSILKCDPSCVNIKATTGEKLGFVGREEGIMAQAVVLLVRV